MAKKKPAEKPMDEKKGKKGEMPAFLQKGKEDKGYAKGAAKSGGKGKRGKSC